MDWRKLLRPLKDGTFTTPLIKRIRRAAPPEPAPDAFISPLYAAIDDVVRRKARFCHYSCIGCTYSAGDKQCSFDLELRTVLDANQDPAPYVDTLITELRDTRKENQALRQDLAVARQDVNPNKRFMLLIGSGVAGLIAKAVWDVWLSGFIISRISDLAPFLLALLP